MLQNLLAPFRIKSKRDVGRAAEDHALQFLIRHDLRLVERNFRGARGEIDLIMRHDATLVFVEVRYRRSTSYGSGAESVDWKKQTKLRTTAELYLSTRGMNGLHACRFDVVAVTLINDAPLVEWIQDAFQSETE